LKPLRCITNRLRNTFVAFTPKGGCPLKPLEQGYPQASSVPVAFTPKGGCPLKPTVKSASI